MNDQFLHQQPSNQELSNLLKTFTSLSIDTVSTLMEEGLVGFVTDYRDAGPVDEKIENMLTGSFETIELTPSDTSFPVVACDMSTVKIAETVRGTIWAVKGSIIVNEAGRFSGTVVGPFIYNVSSYTAGKIVEALFVSLGIEEGKTYVDLAAAPKVISNIFEKVLQLHAATYLNGGLLLLDGALTSGPLDSPAPVVEKIVENAKTFGIGVTAFSKSTTLMILGRNILSFAEKCRPPYVIKLPMAREHSMLCKNCSVYVSHLSPSYFPFRVDVASRTSDEEVFRSLLASENIIYGYPESLIIAHQLAKLSRLDVLSLRTCIESLAKIRFMSDIDIRSAIFAPLNR